MSGRTADARETTPAAEVQVDDIPEAKICPACGHLLLKHRVGHGLGFLIDNCTTCGGFWLDGGEWEALKSHNLHDNLRNVLAPSWQHDALRDKVCAGIEKAYAARLGEADYRKVGAFGAWLKNHPQRASIIAYLTEADGGR